MIVEKLTEIPKIKNSDLVKVKEMGNIYELQYLKNCNHRGTVKKIDNNHMLIISTGEVIEINQENKKKNRLDNKKALYRTFNNLKEIINSNCYISDNVRWCTLTYAENMTDYKKLCSDFDKFNKRFQYYLIKNGYNKAEHISVVEPQKRGAWHMHILYIWDSKAPFIPNNDFSKLWGHGFVNIRSLENCDNVGVYLTAYLGDLEIDEVIEECPNIRTVEVEENGKKIKKSIIKGGRLSLYPTGINIYRASRGIKKANIYHSYYKDVKENLNDACLTYKTASKIIDDNYENILIKEFYNTQRK